jgi:hypothetical protein
MSSIMRRRRGLIVAIGNSCLERKGCEDPHPLRQEIPVQQLSLGGGAATPAQRVRSIRTSLRVKHHEVEAPTQEIHEIGARTCGSTPGLDKGPTKSHPGHSQLPLSYI